MKRIAQVLALALAAFLGSLFGSARDLSADRPVSYTLKPVTAAECTSIEITRQLDGQGGTVIVATFSFEIKDSNGTPREWASTSLQLTGPQRTSLSSFVTSVAVPQFNSEQNL